MTQRGREPYTEPYTVRLKPEDFQELEDRAHRRGVGRSVLTREIVMEWLHEQRDKDRRRQSEKP